MFPPRTYCVLLSLCLDFCLYLRNVTILTIKYKCRTTCNRHLLKQANLGGPTLIKQHHLKNMWLLISWYSNNSAVVNNMILHTSPTIHSFALWFHVNPSCTGHSPPYVCCHSHPHWFLYGVFHCKASHWVSDVLPYCVGSHNMKLASPDPAMLRVELCWCWCWCWWLMLPSSAGNHRFQTDVCCPPQLCIPSSPCFHSSTPPSHSSCSYPPKV